MIELKNKKFDLFGTEWHIKFEEVVKDPQDNHEIYGMTYRGATNEVIIAKTINGKNISEKEIKITLLHELMHAIFTTGQYSMSNEDEPLVEWTARCLNYLINKNII